VRRRQEGAELRGVVVWHGDGAAVALGKLAALASKLFTSTPPKAMGTRPKYDKAE